MEVKLNKKIIVILSVLLSITIIMSIIGVSYAYFRTIVESLNVSSMRVTTTNLKITYTETKNIVGNEITPGWTDTKEFSIENTGTSTVTYNLLWRDVINTLINTQYLKYSVVGTGTDAFNTESPVTFPTNSSEVISNNISIDPDVIHNYTVTINYINDPEFDQSEDMEKTFAATIEIQSD